MPVSLARCMVRCMVLLASADIARAFAPPRRGARQFRPSLLESSDAPAILEYREWFGGDVSLLRDDDLALGSFAAVAAGANGALFSLARAADGAIEARKASEDRRRRARADAFLGAAPAAVRADAESAAAEALATEAAAMSALKSYVSATSLFGLLAGFAFISRLVVVGA